MTKNRQYNPLAFTLLEVIIVLVIIGIISAVAIPLYISATSVQLKTAANVIASDLEYAKNMAMSTGRNYSVVFDASTESYRINDANGQAISHPVHTGTNYIVSFINDNRLNKVDIVNAAFGTTSTVKFDYLGAPSDGTGASLNSGSVLLCAEGSMLTVRVEPVTGYVTIDANDGQISLPELPSEQSASASSSSSSSSSSSLPSFSFPSSSSPSKSKSRSK